MKRITLDGTLSAQDLMRVYGLSQPSAYRAIKRGYFTLGQHKAGKPVTRIPIGLKLDNATIQEIARHTGRKLAPGGITLAAHGKAISDLRDEIEQAVMIELWVAGISDVALAYKAAKRRGIDVLRAWYQKHTIPLDVWEAEYNPKEIEDE